MISDILSVPAIKIKQKNQKIGMSHLLEDGYCPDTINLNESKEAKDYWYLCFQDLISKLARQASKSCTASDSVERADKLKDHYIHELSRLQEESW